MHLRREADGRTAGTGRARFVAQISHGARLRDVASKGLVHKYGFSLLQSELGQRCVQITLAEQEQHGIRVRDDLLGGDTDFEVR